MNRRTLMGYLVRGGGAVLAAAVAVPSLLLAISPAFSRRTAQWQPLGRVEQFPLGEVTAAIAAVPRDDWAKSLREKKVYVWHRAAGELVVYSRNCTDLSCPVNWDRGSQCFFCPCHGGIFDLDGTPLAGPPSVPLYRYAMRVQEGVLEIDLRSLPPMT